MFTVSGYLCHTQPHPMPHLATSYATPSHTLCHTQPHPMPHPIQHPVTPIYDRKLLRPRWKLTDTETDSIVMLIATCSMHAATFHTCTDSTSYSLYFCMHGMHWLHKLHSISACMHISHASWTALQPGLLDYLTHFSSDILQFRGEWSLHGTVPASRVGTGTCDIHYGHQFLLALMIALLPPPTYPFSDVALKIQVVSVRQSCLILFQTISESAHFLPQVLGCWELQLLSASRAIFAAKVERVSAADAVVPDCNNKLSIRHFTLGHP
jgi:hypothetical protein